MPTNTPVHSINMNVKGRTGDDKARKRVLILGPLPPPVGGVENFTLALLESDALNEFDVRHCDTTKGRPKSTQGRWDIGNTLWAWRHFSRVKKAMREFCPDVVYIPVSSTWSGFFRDGEFARIASVGKTRVIGHVHGGRFRRALEYKGIGASYIRAILSRFDRLLVLGSPFRDALQKYGFEGGVEIVSSTARQVAADAGEMHTPNYDSAAPLRLLFVGQVGKRKGVPETLEALKLLKDEGHLFRMDFLGDEEYLGEMAQANKICATLGLEAKCKFHSAVPSEELFDWYKSADATILCSHNEGLPIVIIESGLFGVPVVSTLVGAIGDLLKDDKNALFVEPGNVEQIAGCIRRLIVEPGLRERLGRQLRNDVQPFAPERVFHSIAQQIRIVLQAPVRENKELGFNFFRFVSWFI